MKSIPNAVVVGYGYAGRVFHAPLIKLEPCLRLHGIVSSDPEKRRKIASNHACKTYESIEGALADPEVDLLVLALPNHLHAPLACQAMEAGKHVVTDKPMCRSLAECDRMIETARKTNRILSVFQNRRFDGDFLTLCQLLETGRLGKLRWLEMAWQMARPTRGWRSEPALGGGRLFDLGAHMIDQALLLFPEPVERVYCRMHWDHPDHQDESHAMVVIGFEGGQTAVIDTGGMHALPKPRFHAFGTAGAFRKEGLDPQEEALKAGCLEAAAEPREGYGTWSDGEKTEVIQTQAGSWRSYYRTIAAQIKGDPLPHAPVQLEEARRVMAVLEAAYQSGRDGRVVTDIA